MIIKGLSFFTDGENFVVDVAIVQKVARKLEVTPVPTAPREVVGIANMRGKVVTILSIAALLKRRQSIEKERSLQGLHSLQIVKTINAVIFKSFANDEDQMGFIMDKPGDLIKINKNKISPPPLTEETEESFFISGVFEYDDKLYRIINIDSIISRFYDGIELNK